MIFGLGFVCFSSVTRNLDSVEQQCVVNVSVCIPQGLRCVLKGNQFQRLNLT